MVAQPEDLGRCRQGEADTVTYNPSTGQLVISPDLTSHLTVLTATGSGCAGVIKPGDQETFAATYAVSPRIQITNP
jgi:hypothetical protein